MATRPECRPRGQDRRGAARCRPICPLRDWHERGKSRASDQTYTLPYLPTPLSPFHAEPLQEGILGFRHEPREQSDANPALIATDESNTLESMIHSYLVRYGVMGHVGRFSTERCLDSEFHRGRLVVVRSDRGTEIGEILIEDPQIVQADKVGGGARIREPQGQGSGRSPDRLKSCAMYALSAASTFFKTVSGLWSSWTSNPCSTRSEPFSTTLDRMASKSPAYAMRYEPRVGLMPCS